MSFKLGPDEPLRKSLPDEMIIQALARSRVLCGHAVGLQIALEVKLVFPVKPHSRHEQLPFHKQKLPRACGAFIFLFSSCHFILFRYVLSILLLHGNGPWAKSPSKKGLRTLVTFKMALSTTSDPGNGMIPQAQGGKNAKALFNLFSHFLHSQYLQLNVYIVNL